MNNKTENEVMAEANGEEEAAEAAQGPGRGGERDGAPRVWRRPRQPRPRPRPWQMKGRLSQLPRAVVAFRKPAAIEGWNNVSDRK